MKITLLIKQQQKDELTRLIDILKYAISKGADNREIGLWARAIAKEVDAKEERELAELWRRL